jgi:hypothetical protein
MMKALFSSCFFAFGRCEIERNPAMPESVGFCQNRFRHRRLLIASTNARQAAK